MIADFLLAGIVAIALMGYLIYTMIYPERF